MNHPRFALYSPSEDALLCTKLWHTPSGAERSNVLWAKVSESHYLLFSTTGIDELIDSLHGRFPFEDLGDKNKQVIEFLVPNGYHIDLFVIPIRKIGFSYTDEFIPEGANFIEGFKV